MTALGDERFDNKRGRNCSSPKAVCKIALGDGGGDRWASPRLTAPQTDQDSKRPRPEPKPADLHHLDYPPAIRPPNGARARRRGRGPYGWGKFQVVKVNWLGLRPRPLRVLVRLGSRQARGCPAIALHDVGPGQILRRLGADPQSIQGRPRSISGRVGARARVDLG